MHLTTYLLPLFVILPLTTACFTLSGVRNSRLHSLHPTFYDNCTPICSTISSTSVFPRQWDGRGELAISCFDTTHYA